MSTKRRVRDLRLVHEGQGPEEPWSKGQAESVLSLALDKIEACAWLLDQVQTGELSFLQMKDQSVPCWNSTVSQDAETLSGALERLAVENISAGVQDVRRASKALDLEL